MSRATVVLSPDYDRAARVALALQIPIALVALLLLDHGHMAKLCGLSMIAFWTAAGLIAARRPLTPNLRDLWFWRWGYVPLLALIVLLDSLRQM